MQREIPLRGGRTTTGVVRVGNTVRRPIKGRGSLTQELLSHLERHGFGGAPRFLGIDDAGREILSYIRGSVPPELGNFTDAQLMAAARLLRKLHDATQDSPLRPGFEVLCHGDPSPCNCVFVKELPTAFIDFDGAHPGSRLEELGHAAWLWLDLGNDELSPEWQGQRVVDFFEYYGLHTADAVSSIISAQASLSERTTITGVREWSNDCRAWVERNRERLAAAIAARSIRSMPPTATMDKSAR